LKYKLFHRTTNANFTFSFFLTQFPFLFPDFSPPSFHPQFPFFLFLTSPSFNLPSPSPFFSLYPLLLTFPLLPLSFPYFPFF